MVSTVKHITSRNNFLGIETDSAHNPRLPSNARLNAKGIRNFVNGSRNASLAIGNDWRIDSCKADRPGILLPNTKIHMPATTTRPDTGSKMCLIRFDVTVRATIGMSASSGMTSADNIPGSASVKLRIGVKK